MNTIILGDLHIGAGLNIGKIEAGSYINSRITDKFNLLNWILEQALNYNVDNIIITGDVFEDPKPNHYLIQDFISWFKTCQANNVNVHIVVGNHDILRTGSIYTSVLDIFSETEMDGINIYKNIDTIFLNTTAYTFIPFRDRKSFNVNTHIDALNIIKSNIIYELSYIPSYYRKILVGHLAIEGSIFVGDEILDSSNELFCPLEMFFDYDYTFMGHVHKPQVFKKSPYISHIGSMDISNFGETDHNKYIVLIKDDNIETINLPVRPLKKITIEISKNEIDPTNFILNNIKNIDFNKSIVKVEISTNNEKPISKSIIEKFIISNGAFNVSGISETKKTTIIKKTNELQSDMTVNSAIKKYAELYIDKNIRNDFIELAINIATESIK